MGASIRKFGVALWSILLSLPLFFLLLVLGMVKGVIIGAIALPIIFFGHVAVALGLWPVFFFWTYDSILRTKRLSLLLKILTALFIPVVLTLWLVTVICGSILVGAGYGFFTPLVGTFEAVGEGRSKKLKGSIMDGTFETIQGSCTIVRDFTDCCCHSCPAYLSDFRDGEPNNGPYSIRLLEIPGCIAAGICGVLLDVPFFGLIALVKSPFMLIKGWDRLLDDLIVSRDGTCIRVASVPFAGLAILLWPLVVVAAGASAVFSSIFVGLNAALVVHQEESFKSGLFYAVAMLAEFDEYTNDLLYLREGSCLPRPVYRAHVEVAPTAVPSNPNGSFKSSRLETETKSGETGMIFRQLSTSKSLRQTIQEVKMIQVWDHMFKSFEKSGKDLIEKGMLTASDLEIWLQSGNKARSRLVNIGLPAYTLVQHLIATASHPGVLLLHNGIEVTVSNRPQEKFMDWFFEPLLVLKAQIHAAQLQPGEERYLEKLALLSSEPDRIEAWDNGSIPPLDNLKKGELEAISRRIQGISTSVSRFPTFRRRYEKFIKALYAYSQAQGSFSGSLSREQDSFSQEYV